MLIRVLGLVCIIVGIAGLALPFVPGILLIAAGVSLVLKDGTAKIRALMPEKIPAVAAIFYSMIPAKMFLHHHRSIAATITLKPGNTFLDVGTGPGLLPLEVAVRFPGTRIVGIDLSEKMIEIADENKERGAGNEQRGVGKTNPEFRVMDAKNLDFPENSFDLIVSTSALHHWKEPTTIFNEIHRCLKPGGEALIYGGYGDASDDDIIKGFARPQRSFPPPGFFRHILKIHGFTQAEYDTTVLTAVKASAFGTASFERDGIMMRLRFKK